MRGRKSTADVAEELHAYYIQYVCVCACVCVCVSLSLSVCVFVLYTHTAVPSRPHEIAIDEFETKLQLLLMPVGKPLACKSYISLVR